MKAAVYEKYGPPEVLQIKDVEKPVPGDNEVLIKIFATSVSSGDVKMRGFSDIPPIPWLPFRLMIGLFAPRKKIIGFIISGEVEAMGKDVKKFEVGNKVFGSVGFGGGAYAQYKALGEDEVLIKKPENMTHEQAAAIPFGAMTSLYFFRKGNIQEGQKVLVYGASGALGTYAIQLAKHFGAEVSGVCSTTNLELVRSLGADHVIDYTSEDLTKNGQKYDIIFDTVGKSPFSESVKSLNEKGFYLRAVHMELMPLLKGLWVGMTTKKTVVGGVASEKVEDLEFLKGLFEDGELKPVIDKVYPLEQIAQAHEYVERGHKKGNVVISIEHAQE